VSQNFSKSIDSYQKAQQFIPGGVNSPVRAFKAVGGQPVFMEKGEGAFLYDIDGNRYVDYLGGWGSLILGHRHPRVILALEETLNKGTSFGTPTELETALAKEIVAAVPSIEMVRLVNSGTEATMSALRLARGYTGRNKIIKFEGCYHGHADYLLVKAGSGALTLGMPTSAGISPNIIAETIVVPYNDLTALNEVFTREGENIAAVIIEPVAGNMGVILPQPGFLEGLRELTRCFGALLIFDEVITGFRLAYGGAQEIYGINPDLTCLGKIIGGGLPVGAYGGMRQIMEQVAPVGPVYQAGTLAGNPLAVAAGLATLRTLKQPGTYDDLARKTKYIVSNLTCIIREVNAEVTINYIGSMVTIFFTPIKVKDYQTACHSDTEKYARFFHRMLAQGIYLPPSQFETCFISLSIMEEQISQTIEAFKKAIAFTDT